MRDKIIIFLMVFILYPSVCGFTGELNEGQAVEYFKEALSAQKAGDIDYALTLYTKAIYLKPDFAKAHNNLGTLYAYKGDYTKAEEEYKRAITIDSDYTIALRNLALLYLEMGDQEKFHEYWKRAAGIDLYSPFLIDDGE